MANNIPGNLNINDTATFVGPTQMTDGAVGEGILSANDDRLGVRITVTGVDAFIKCKAADNNLDGELIQKNGIFKLDQQDGYTGEISIISALGAAKPTFRAVEW